PTSPFLDAIPPPERIRERLSALLRETDFLRSLLRLAEREEREQDEPGRGPSQDAQAAPTTFKKLSKTAYTDSGPGRGVPLLPLPRFEEEVRTDPQRLPGSGTTDFAPARRGTPCGRVCIWHPAFLRPDKVTDDPVLPESRSRRESFRVFF